MGLITGRLACRELSEGKLLFWAFAFGSSGTGAGFGVTDFGTKVMGVVVVHLK